VDRQERRRAGPAAGGAWRLGGARLRLQVSRKTGYCTSSTADFGSVTNNVTS
jgi:hypothetical protein